MLKEIKVKTQFNGEFRRVFIDTLNNVDLIVWYENNQIIGYQIEGIGEEIINFIYKPNTTGKFSLYLRDGKGDSTKDFLIESRNKINKESLVNWINHIEIQEISIISFLKLSLK
jgi:hypothetical protein